MTHQMLDTIATIKGAMVIAGIATSSILIGDATGTISEQTPISLGAGVAVGATIVMGAWYLSSRLQRITDELRNINKRLDSLPCDKNSMACPKSQEKK